MKCSILNTVNLQLLNKNFMINGVECLPTIKKYNFVCKTSIHTDKLWVTIWKLSACELPESFRNWNNTSLSFMCKVFFNFQNVVYLCLPFVSYKVLPMLEKYSLNNSDIFWLSATSPSFVLIVCTPKDN